MAKEIKKEIDLNELPKWINDGNGKAKEGTINWLNSVGYKVHFIYDDIEGEIKIIDYYSKEQKLKIKYEKKEITISIPSFTYCKIGKLLNKVTGKFKIEVGTLFKDEKRDITIIDREYRYKTNKTKYVTKEKWYKYKCNECGCDVDWKRECDIFSGYGCRCCCYSPQILVQGINDIPTTNPEMVKYFQGGYDEAKLYTKCGGGNPNNPKGYIFAICPDCGKIKDRKTTILSIYVNSGMKCICNDGMTFPNKFAFKTLDELGINFETEYSPDWIKPKRYDFYFELNNKKYIIEMDGGFHFIDNTMSGQTKEESKAIDDYKDDQASLHDIEVIRIDCDYKHNDRFEYIKNSMLNNEKLNSVFDLNVINWIACGEYANSNFMKRVCEYKRDNYGLSSLEISKIMKIDTSTVRDYLKQGNKIWEWCNYDPKEEIRKSSAKNGKKNGKQVGVFKDGISLGVFYSCLELERESENLFGTKLLQTCIGAVCLGRQKEHKGFTFKYVEENY